MKTPFNTPEDFKTFAVVVEDEVVMNITFPIEQEMLIAIYSSEPKFISVPPNNQPPLGAKLEGGQFNVSVE